MCLLLGWASLMDSGQPGTTATFTSCGRTESGAKGRCREKATEAKVSPNDPVITVKGACTDPAKKGDIETVVTREQSKSSPERYSRTWPSLLSCGSLLITPV